MSFLEVREVAKTLGSGERAAVLRGVSLRVQGGAWVGLRGATGSGKTTLMRIIAGLEFPDRGEVWLDGERMSTLAGGVPPGRRGIGFVFQSLGLWPHLTVGGHLDYMLGASRLAANTRAARRAELLEAFHLHGMVRRYPWELSGGEKHLLAIARALSGQVRLLLLDEPFSGLDGALKEVVVQALKRLREEWGMTALLVSHLAEDFQALCSGVLHLREGRIAETSAAQV